MIEEYNSLWRVVEMAYADGTWKQNNSAPGGIERIRHRMIMHRTRLWEAQKQKNHDEYEQHKMKYDYLVMHILRLGYMAELEKIERKMQQLPEFIKKEMDEFIAECAT